MDKARIPEISPERGYLARKGSKLRDSSPHNSCIADYFESVVNLRYLFNRDEAIVNDLVEGIDERLGTIICGDSGSGKSFLGFDIVRRYESKLNHAVKIFSPSTIWERRMGGGMFLVYVGRRSFNPISPSGDEMLSEREYLWLRNMLLRKETVIFRIYYHKSERTLGFLKLCFRILFEYNRARLLNEDADVTHYLCVLEESQLSFKSRGSMQGSDTMEILKYVSLGRSDANLHYLVLTQRLAEVSTALVERFDLVSSAQSGDNTIKKVQRSLPKAWRKTVYELKNRQFLWRHQNEVVIFRSLDYEASGKPWKVAPPVPEKAKGFVDRLFGWLKPKINENSMEPLSIPHEIEDEVESEKDTFSEEDDEFVEELDSGEGEFEPI